MDTGIPFCPPPPPPTEPPRGAEVRSTPSPEEKRYGLERKKFRVEVLTLLAVIAYAGIAGWQLHQMIRQNALTKEALDETRLSNERAQRAWVLPLSDNQEISPPGAIQPNQPFTVRIALRNSGNSPAHDITVRYWALLGPIEWSRVKLQGDPPLPKQKPGDSPRGLLGPQHNAEIPFQNITLDQSEMDRLAKGADALYFIGQISYADQFSNRHVTQFCYFHIPTRTTPFNKATFCASFNFAS
jgi:hypothetical protein